MEASLYYLLKFGEESNIKKLYEKGEIYMNTVQAFADLEKKEVGDKFERTVEIKNFKEGNLKLTSVDSGETHNFHFKNLQYKKDFQGEMGNIYSTYSISDLLLKRKKLHRVDKRMLLFGSHCLIINDVCKFFLLIENELKRLGIGYVHNLVRYHDYKKNNHSVSYFHKSHIYSYQHEHRFVVYNKTGLPLILNVGPLSEISEIYPSEDIIKYLTFENNYCP